MSRHLVKQKNSKKLKAFGANLKRLRNERGLTQEQLADIAGISENSVVTLEAGMLNTTIATCFELAKALDIEPKKLFDF